MLIDGKEFARARACKWQLISTMIQPHRTVPKRKPKQNPIQRIERETRAILRSRNIVGFGIGCKYSSKQSTGELAIHVFVSRKLSKSKLSKDDLIPDTIGGLP